MNESPVSTDRMLEYLDALLDDPQAISPPDLSAADVDFVRALLRLYPVPAQPGARRRRVWQRVITQAIAQRVTTPLTSNGRHTYKESEMVTYPAQAAARPQPVRGLWTLGLAAAALVVVAITLLLARANGTPPEHGADIRPILATTTPLATLVPSGTPVNDVAVITATPLGMSISTGTFVPEVVTATVTPSPAPFDATLLPPSMIPTGTPLLVVPNMVVTAEIPPTAVPMPLVPPHAAEVMSFDPGAVVALAWSPDGQLLAVAYADRITLQNVANLTAPEIELRQAGATALAFSPDGRWLASAHQDGTVSLWDARLTQGELVAMLSIEAGPLAKVSFNPDGTYLILEAANGAITIWSLNQPGPTLSTIPPREGDLVSLWGCSASFSGGTPPQSRPLDEYTITSTRDGIDLASRNGKEVLAAGAGTVAFAGWSDTGYGYTVVIAHGETFSLYAHLEQAQVACGQKVSDGEQIGTVGSTGMASGPVLHFEIRDAAWNVLDPHQFIMF